MLQQIVSDVKAQLFGAAAEVVDMIIVFCAEPRMRDSWKTEQQKKNNETKVAGERFS